MNVILIVYKNDKPTERHLKAADSRIKLVQSDDVILVEMDRTPAERSSRALGDPRDLPYLRDMFGIALGMTMNPDDVIVWTNDDVQLDPALPSWARSVVRLHDAISMRRYEPGQKGVHMGRELFAFTAQWMIKNIDKIPDFIVGCPFFDIVLAAYLRKQKGFESTVTNMIEDFYPVDSENEFAIHEPHQSAWGGENENKFPANLHNRKLAKEWCAANMPSLKL